MERGYTMDPNPFTDLLETIKASSAPAHHSAPMEPKGALVTPAGGTWEPQKLVVRAFPEGCWLARESLESLETTMDWEQPKPCEQKMSLGKDWT